MKKYIGFMMIALFVGILGCGGGGGGGGSNGSDGTSATTGYTSGVTDAGADSTIIGQTVGNQTGTPIAGITIRFLDSSNNVVATATSRANGYFDANVPTSATKFEADSSTTPSNYYNAFKYGSLWYYPTIVCRAPLPTITPGVLKPLPYQIQYLPLANGPPPPPPGGCGS